MSTPESRGSRSRQLGPTRGTTPSWRDEFILALRLHDVPGRRIGDLLAEVESHCAESGQEPSEAFGPPRAYAAALAEDSGRRTTQWRPAALATGVVAGATLALEAASAMGDGTPATFHSGILLLLPVIFLVGAVVGRRLDLVVRHPVGAALTGSALFVGYLVATVLARSVVVSVPPLPALVGGVALIVLCALGLRGIGVAPDPVVDPRTDTARAGPWWLSMALWGLPAVLLLVAVLTVLMLT